MLWLKYVRGGLIQERTALRSAWNVHMPELSLWIGRVESYWDESTNYKVRWRTLDHWYCDYKKGYMTREDAAQELALKCVRTVKLIADRRERLALAAGPPSA